MSFVSARLRPRSVSRLLAAVLAAALVLTACGGNGEADPDESSDAASDEQSNQLGVAIASYDLAVGQDQRLLAGLFTQDQELLVHGEVTFQLGFLGQEQVGEAELREPTTATFLPVPGMEPSGSSDVPVMTGQADAEGSGVYESRVDFDQPGYWGLRVIAEVEDGRQMEGNTVFSVFPEQVAPRVGDQAPRTVNWTIADVEAGTIEPTSLDSRARDGDIPDPQMHDTTVAAAIDAGRPSVVILSTPVFCVSRFCGPLMDEMSELSGQYGDRAEFIHIEIWQDFESSVINEAAQEWIQGADGEREPWAYVVGGDGEVIARWDNVIDRDELVEVLDSLPA